MEPEKVEERRRLVAEHSSKKLATGRWAQVLAVFVYATPCAPKSADKDFDAVREAFKNADLPNLVIFSELARMDEQHKGVPVSYNLSLKPRLTPEEENDPQMFMHYLAHPDILVGTRNGVEASITWLQNLVANIPTAVPESLQVIDKIFGEALVVLHKGGKTETTIREILATALGGPLPE